MNTRSALVIFGASGDLTSRKLIPSLFSLHCKGRLPENLWIVGAARTKLNDAQFHASLREKLPGVVDKRAWDHLTSRIRYCPVDVTSADDYVVLQKQLEVIAGGCKTNRLY